MKFNKINYHVTLNSVCVGIVFLRVLCTTLTTDASMAVERNGKFPIEIRIIVMGVVWVCVMKTERRTTFLNEMCNILVSSVYSSLWMGTKSEVKQEAGSLRWRPFYQFPY